jgi:hypothetical protein
MGYGYGRDPRTNRLKLMRRAALWLILLAGCGSPTAPRDYFYQGVGGPDLAAACASEGLLVDDTGLVGGKPLNAEATKLYHSVCRPGTTNTIHGDVALVLDADFA